VSVGRVVVVLGAVAMAVIAHVPAAAGSPARSTTLSLIAPPTFAAPTQPFVARLGVTGTVPASSLDLTVTLYEAVPDPSVFDETLGGSAPGPVLAGPDTVALTSLSPDPTVRGGVDLTIPVTAGGEAGAGSGPVTVDLHCPLGSCGGVYPVRLELTEAHSDTVVSRLLTYLVYNDPPAHTQPLLFALVVPLTLPPSTPPTAGGSAAPDLSALGQLTDLVTAMSGSRAQVPLTVAPSPGTVSALAAHRQGRAALAALRSLSSDPDRQTLCGPFAPVNASALVESGLATELADQVRRGAQALNTAGLHTGGCTDDDIWPATGTLSADALKDLAALGYDDVVVPTSAVSFSPAPSTTPTRRFTLGGSQTTGNAMLSDPGLSDRL